MLREQYLDSRASKTIDFFYRRRIINAVFVGCETMGPVLVPVRRSRTRILFPGFKIFLAISLV